MNVTFLAPAYQELEDTVDFYEDLLPRLGKTFYKEVMDCIRLIERFPNSWKKVGKRTRKRLLKKFPYLILYIPEENELVITAIAHQHQEPEYYLDRVQ